MEDRIAQITRCMYELEICMKQIHDGDTRMGGAWLGYMDWLEELHYQVHSSSQHS